MQPSRHEFIRIPLKRHDFRLHPLHRLARAILRRPRARPRAFARVRHRAQRPLPVPPHHRFRVFKRFKIHVIFHHQRSARLTRRLRSSSRRPIESRRHHPRAHRPPISRLFVLALPRPVALARDRRVIGVVFSPIVARVVVPVVVVVLVVVGFHPSRVRPRERVESSALRPLRPRRRRFLAARVVVSSQHRRRDGRHRARVAFGRARRLDAAV